MHEPGAGVVVAGLDARRTLHAVVSGVGRCTMLVEASRTLFFKFGDLDATKPAGGIKIRVQTIVHYVEKYSRELIERKRAWLPEKCPL